MEGEKTNMKASSNTVRHQEGPSKTGESLTLSSGSVSPIVSGGGKCCFQDESPSKTIDKAPCRQMSGARVEERSESPLLLSDAFGRKRQRQGLDLDSDDDTTDGSDNSVVKISTARRGRGRPPTTGKYVGLSKAKKDLRQLEEQALIMETEEELKRKETKKTSSQKVKETPLIQLPEELSAQSLRDRALQSVTMVFDVARKSKNLKGTSVKELNEAASSIRDAVIQLSMRTKTQETRKLNLDILQLQQQNKELQEEVKALKAAILRKPVAEPQLASPVQNTNSLPEDQLEELKRSLLTSVGSMLDARFAGLEDRLLPAKILRPPLAADKRKEQRDDSGTRSVNSRVASNKNAISNSSTRKAGQSQSYQSQNTEKETESFASVVQSGKTNTKKVKNGASSVQSQGVHAKKGPQSLPKEVPNKKRKKKKRKKKNPKVNPPRTSAVVVSLLPEAQEKGITYTEALLKAKNAIKLQDLSIERLGFRTALTGAKIIEVFGDSNGTKADLLAENMRKVLASIAKISRPQKLVDIRINGLDDSITVDEVKAAVAEKGGCSPEYVKVGAIRTGLWGSGSTIVQCPIAAVKTLVSAGRLLLGWSSANVKVLERRPLRCYRCMNIGHTRQQCSSEVDRSEICFRCGNIGHKTATCFAKPNCAVCVEANKPASHIMGRRACNPPAQKGKYIKLPYRESQNVSVPQQNILQEDGAGMSE